MKGFNIIIVIFLILGSCKQQNTQSETEEKIAELRKKLRFLGRPSTPRRTIKEGGNSHGI